MRGVFVWVMSMLLVSCNQQQAKLSEAEMRGILAAHPGMTDACLSKLRTGGFEAMPVETDQCFRMAPAERWRGLWARDFELSRFCPTPARECSYDTPGQQIWLSFSSRVPDADRLESGLYAMDFLRRKTADRGHFGHASQYNHEIVVDRIIAVKELPPQPVKETRQ